jgi:hypothetical protein
VGSGLWSQLDDFGFSKQADFTETGRKNAKKSADLAEKLRKSVEHGSSIPGGMSPDFSSGFRLFSTEKE